MKEIQKKFNYITNQYTTNSASNSKHFDLINPQTGSAESKRFVNCISSRSNWSKNIQQRNNQSNSETRRKSDPDAEFQRAPFVRLFLLSLSP